jgi:xanthine dehydrogenase YagT iron-sulfur-binding subunit
MNELPRPSAPGDDDALATPADSGTTFNLRVNGVVHEVSLDPRVSLLDALREHLQLTGTKKGCNQGACGACTVLVDGTRILSCLALAIQYAARDITTIEGVATDGELHRLQAAFVTCDGFQCGYCTSGQICSAIGMFKEFQDGVPSAATPDMAETALVFSEQEIKERMSGNLCRCGAYVGICDAVRDTFGDGIGNEAAR